MWKCKYTLRRNNTENLKQIFPKKKLRGHSPNFHIHVSWAGPTIGLLSAAGNLWTDLGNIHINRSETYECGNWDWGLAILRKGIHKWALRCSAIRPVFKTTLSLLVTCTNFICAEFKGCILIIFYFTIVVEKGVTIWQGAVWPHAEAQSEPPFLHQSVSIFRLVYFGRAARPYPLNKFAASLSFQN